MPEVSVIIPAYNCADFISEAVDSILRQACKDTEIIIVDDGSTDNIKEVTLRYKGYVSYIFQPNRGSSSARNRGICASHGRYIMFLDADDAAEDICIEKHIERFNSSESFGMSYSAVSFIDSNSRNIGGIFRSKEYGRDEFFAKMLERNLVATASGVMIKKEVLDRAGYFDERLAYNEEYELWLRVAEKYSVSYIDQPLVRYRRHARNISINTAKQKESEIRIIRELGSESIKEKAAAPYKRDEDRFLALAKIFLKLGDYKESFIFLKRCRDIGIDNDEVHFLLGSYFYSIKDYKNASKEYQLSINNNKWNAASCNNLGVLRFMEGYHEAAMALFTRAIAVNKDYYDPCHNIECIKNNRGAQEMGVTLMPLRERLVPYCNDFKRQSGN